MKQRTLLLTFLALFGIVQVKADVTINETNFPDENFRNYLLSQSYGIDGVITDEEILGITEISVESKNITSLKGIEYFTALTMLFCYNNQLTSLDVSQNTALIYLECYTNQLTSLDVSKNTALTSLRCGVNQLTSLDVSQNTALTELSCYKNQLTSLDVSKNTALAWLVCYENQLTSLDVSQNTMLTYLLCGENQLTSLDISQNTALIYLECYTNQLTSLDVLQNTALTYLSCGRNQLTSLNVSQNTALTKLFCYGNQIKGNEMDALVESLPNISNGNLEVIFNENEGNEMTTVQVAAAKAKGWTPYYWDENEWNWKEYPGSTPSGIGATLNDKGQQGNDVYYDLQGRRVEHPTKGMYILNGRKVVIK